MNDSNTPVGKGEGALFWKLVAEGNSYVVIEDPAAVARLIPWINDPRLGLGGDGLLLRGREGGVLSMRVFNADGTEAPMCGNGARCLAALDFQSSFEASQMDVSVICGELTLLHRLLDRVSMLIEARTTLGDEPIAEDHTRPGTIYQLHVGTPHLVAFRDLADLALEREGPRLERSLAGGTNVMFTAVAGPGRLKVIPWERGVGAVFGCATGAAAAAIATARRVPGWPAYTEVSQPGGKVGVEWDSGGRKLRIRGRARTVACGRVALH